MRARARSRLAVVLLALALVVVLFGPPTFDQRDLSEPKTADDVGFVRPVSNGSTFLWPYTSRAESFDRATLPMNLLVLDDATTTRRLLLTSGGGSDRLSWNASAKRWGTGEVNDSEVTVNGTGVQWTSSTGGARFTYLRAQERSQWTDATYHVKDGFYFGARHHLRLYEGGSGVHTWTAIQAHHEYWDWFRLRHQVDSLGAAQHHVERDFLGTRLHSDIRRERWGNGGAIDADGWVTVVDLKPYVLQGPSPDAPVESPPPGSRTDPPAQNGSRGPVPATVPLSVLGALLVVGLERTGSPDRSARTRWPGPYHVLLFVVTALLPVAVRVGAITVEQFAPEASPYVIGAPFYVLLVVGLPVAATVLGRSLPAEEAFAAAVLGMGTGVMADYAYLQVMALPYGAVVQQLVLLFGLGLIAAGGTRWSSDLVVRHRYRLPGIAVWAGAVLWPLVS